MFRGAWKRFALAVVIALAAVVPAGALAAPATPASRVVAVASLESGVLSEMNTIRRSHGLQPLRLSTALGSAARQHSQSMATQGYFSHNSADGSQFWKRVQGFYPQGHYGYWSVGENLLWQSPDVDAAGALQMWMASPPHRENLLTARWREVGISAVHVAAAPGTFNGLDVTIVTADFGVRH
jgi:uncharacterized protein YkwD